MSLYLSWLVVALRLQKGFRIVLRIMEDDRQLPSQAGAERPI